ncbi:MAG: four-carbon acid sugar kinase family protein [Aphanocapsa lilacina HA4352-LM1]|jgi:uncharacterized protein YgbK (DUF1537 family)|nr:four-carbon acid sugar kinase family protein [Aphanocapsa lilacina HA4352-LM1]
MTSPAVKLVVIDDDPTGSQTVHGCLLLMQWDVETLQLGIADDSPLMFILANTRALDSERAAQTTRAVCRNLKTALAEAGVADYLLVSRSDSTLRGHYPLETDVIAQEMGPIDAHFLVPAFLEGGRLTRDSVHYLNGVPVHETEFARDSVFAYRHSYLPAYIEEKTGGRTPAEAVERLVLADIRGECLQERLMALQDNRSVVVDAEVQDDLDRFARVLLRSVERGKRFLLRSAASVLTALAALPPQPVPAEAMASFVRGGWPGAVIVGSHVRKTTEQLERLLQEPGTAGIAVEVERLLAGGEAARAEVLTEVHAAVAAAHARGETPVVYTSRRELTFPDVQTRLAFGETVSGLLMAVERHLPETIGYLVSKGGITSNDTLSEGLALRTARLLGQILPGCSVVRTPAEHPHFPDLPVVLFPGNVGDKEALAVVYRRLSRPAKK